MDNQYYMNPRLETVIPHPQIERTKAPILRQESNRAAALFMATPIRDHPLRRLLSGPSGATVLRAGMVVMISLFFSSLVPPPLVPLMLSRLLLFAAVIAGFVALVQRQRLWAEHLTSWDEGALFVLMSLASAQLVDPVAVAQTLEQMNP